MGLSDTVGARMGLTPGCWNGSEKLARRGDAYFRQSLMRCQFSVPARAHEAWRERRPDLTRARSCWGLKGPSWIPSSERTYHWSWASGGSRRWASRGDPQWRQRRALGTTTPRHSGQRGPSSGNKAAMIHPAGAMNPTGFRNGPNGSLVLGIKSPFLAQFPLRHQLQHPTNECRLAARVTVHSSLLGVRINPVPQVFLRDAETKCRPGFVRCHALKNHKAKKIAIYG